MTLRCRLIAGLYHVHQWLCALARHWTPLLMLVAIWASVSIGMHNTYGWSWAVSILMPALLVGSMTALCWSIAFVCTRVGRLNERFTTWLSNAYIQCKRGPDVP